MKTLRRWQLLPLLTALALGCEPPGKPRESDRPVPADQVKDFDVLYKMHCAACHGVNGKFGPAPPLNDPLFRALVSESELERVITSGRGAQLMPAFPKEQTGSLTAARVRGSLTAAQIQVLVYEIKGIPYKIVEKIPGDSDGLENKMECLGETLRR